MSTRRRFAAVSLPFSFLLLCSPHVSGQEKKPPKGNSGVQEESGAKKESSAKKGSEVKKGSDGKQALELPPPRITYKGRKIARTMHWEGAPWLLRSSREMEERASRLLELLDVREGQVVCDLGAGVGYHTLPLAKRVGKTGKVIASDIQKEMIKMLEARTKLEKITNVEGVVGTVIDPGLAPNSCDLILLVDVYHEFSHPEHMLRKIRAALKKKGRAALVEFRSEDKKVPIKKEHKMSKEQILKEWLPNGFKLVREVDELPWQHLMFFERAPLVPKTTDKAQGNEPKKESKRGVSSPNAARHL